jgi:hypothetical protein
MTFKPRPDLIDQLTPHGRLPTEEEKPQPHRVAANSLPIG